MSAEAEVKSLLRYCYDVQPMQTYEDRLPQDFTTPCLYFPPPMDNDAPDTVQTFKVTYRLYAKVFDKDAQTAVKAAQAMADRIRCGRYRIPLYNVEGTLSGEWLRVQRVEVRKLDDDIVYGVAQLFIQWDSRYKFDRNVYSKMRNFYLDERVKG